MTAHILLVDDHQMLRDGLRAIVDLNEEFEVVGEAADGRTAIELASTLRPDVVVMDVVMPGMNGIEATSPEIAPLAGEGEAPPDSAFRSLGSREREVLQLVAEGKTSLEIAALLHIAPKTVETHRQNIMRKVGSHRLADRVKYALREGLTSLDT